MCDGVDIFNPLEGREDQMIEAFVKFYGEEYRPRIEQKFKDTTFIFVPKMCDIRNDTYAFADMYYIEKQEQTFKKLDKEFGIDLSNFNYKRYMPSDVALCRQALLKGEELNGHQTAIMNYFSEAFGICNPANPAKYSTAAVKGIFCVSMTNRMISP